MPCVHPPSRGQPPRLALLFEYAPPFVEPRDRYAADLVRRHATGPEHARLFPTIEASCSGTAAAAPAAAAEGRRACDENGDLVSLDEWHTLVRERPHCASIRSRVLLRGGGGLAVPIFGLGTGSPDDDAGVIAAAIRAGHRLIDTAELYGNEERVRRGIDASGVHPDALVLSSKAGTWCRAPLPPHVAAAVPDEYRRLVAAGSLGGLHPTSRGTLGRAVCIGGAAATRAAFNGTLGRLGVRRLGLYSLHWPLTDAAYALDDARHAAVRLEAWRELVALKREGLVGGIGVSNFSPRQLLPLLAEHAPDVLQVEMHLFLQQPELRALCRQHGILVQAYGHHRPELARHPQLVDAAKALGGPHASAGLLSMRWALQAGAALVPRSSRRLEYIGANKRVFDWALPDAAVEALARADLNTSLFGLHEVFLEDRIA